MRYYARYLLNRQVRDQTTVEKISNIKLLQKFNPGIKHKILGSQMDFVPRFTRIKGTIVNRTKRDDLSKETTNWKSKTNAYFNWGTKWISCHNVLTCWLITLDVWIQFGECKQKIMMQMTDQLVCITSDCPLIDTILWDGLKWYSRS